MIMVLTVAAATIHLFELIAALYSVLALYALIALVVTALWRRKWNIRYEIWHHSHIILAVVAVAAGMLSRRGSANSACHCGNIIPSATTSFRRP
jgi:predicted ferric reductase